MSILRAFAEELDLEDLPRFRLDEKKGFPNEPSIYFLFRGQSSEPLYIGYSINPKTSNEVTRYKVTEIGSENLMVGFVSIDTEFVLSSLKNQFIAIHHPPHNEDNRNTEAKHERLEERSKIARYLTLIHLSKDTLEKLESVLGEYEHVSPTDVIEDILWDYCCKDKATIEELYQQKGLDERIRKTRKVLNQVSDELRRFERS